MVKFIYSTQAQLRDAVRTEFRNSTGRRAHRIAKWLDANLTDAQLKAAFNLTNPQTAALRTKLQTMASRLDALETAAGE
jgi:hypothetical protein